MIDREFIDKIEEMALQGEIPRVIDGRTYYRGREIMDPQLEVISLSTLDGFAALANNLHDGEVPIFGAHVVTPTVVQLLGAPDKHKRRETLVHSEVPQRGAFPFENWLSQEDFVTMAQACFVQTEQLEKILQVIGTLKAGRVTTYEDDGVTQQVAASAGVTRATHIEVPNPVNLRPWRTFVEVDQSESDFILRLRGGDEQQKPQIGLYEVVAGEWKLDAMGKIFDYLNDKLEGEIPVFV